MGGEMRKGSRRMGWGGEQGCLNKILLSHSPQVRNHLDGRLYAIKRIRIRSSSKMMNRITREVELLSQMNHENVVR